MATTETSALTAGGSVSAFVPSSIEQIEQIAQRICDANWAPKSYLTGDKPDVNKVFIGIMQGLELGLKPLQALQSIAVINGTPSIWGTGAMALVESSGLLEDMAVEDIYGPWPANSTKEAIQVGYKVTVKRVGRSPVTRQFTFQDAYDANLLDKAGPWKQYRLRMCFHRAKSWCLNDAFSDVLKGLPLAEEVMGYTSDTEEDRRERPQALAKRSPRGALDKFSDSVDVQKVIEGVVSEKAEAEPDLTESDVVEATAEAEPQQGQDAEADVSQEGVPPFPTSMPETVVKALEEGKLSVVGAWFENVFGVVEPENAQSFVDHWSREINAIAAKSPKNRNAISLIVTSNGCQMPADPAGSFADGQ